MADEDAEYQQLILETLLADRSEAEAALDRVRMFLAAGISAARSAYPPARQEIVTVVDDEVSGAIGTLMFKHNPATPEALALFAASLDTAPEHVHVKTVRNKGYDVRVRTDPGTVPLERGNPERAAAYARLHRLLFKLANLTVEIPKVMRQLEMLHAVEVEHYFDSIGLLVRSLGYGQGRRRPVAEIVSHEFY